MNHQLHWHNSPLVTLEKPLGELRDHIPEFERRPFSITQPHGKVTRTNARLDTIIRKPHADDHDFIPVGVVSPAYALLPHRDVFDEVVRTIDHAGVLKADQRAEDVPALLGLTEYSERMALRVRLPQHLNYVPPDGFPVEIRLECVNSVDGSCRFSALMEWVRLVCSNGLKIGVTTLDFRRRHVGELDLDHLEEVLVSGLAASEAEKRNFIAWHRRAVDWDTLQLWINEELRKTWGFKAAARTWHIARTGYDVEIVGGYKNVSPLDIQVRHAAPVPGARPKAENIYDLSQILAWLARDRKDIQEQIMWRDQIGDILEPLLN